MHSIEQVYWSYVKRPANKNKQNFLYASLEKTELKVVRKPSYSIKLSPSKWKYGNGKNGMRTRFFLCAGFSKLISRFSWSCYSINFFNIANSALWYNS